MKEQAELIPDESNWTLWVLNASAEYGFKEEILLISQQHTVTLKSTISANGKKPGILSVCTLSVQHQFGTNGFQFVSFSSNANIEVAIKKWVQK